MAYRSLGLAPGLEELVALARHEHVTRAAAELGIPQPTLSRSLARLSSSMGVPLLRREGRGVRLTPQGRLLATHAERALDELLGGIRAVQATTDPDTGTVVLGFVHSMGPAIVPALLRSFRRQRPRVTVRLLQASAERLVDGVLSGRLDLCLTAPTPDQPQVAVQRLAQQSLRLFVPHAHALAGRRRVRLRELAGEPLISLTSDHGLRSVVDELLHVAGLAPDHAFEVQEMRTAAGLVASGLGIAILPEGTGTGRAVELTIADAGASRVISLAWSRERDLSPPAAELRDHVRDRAPALLRQRA